MTPADGQRDAGQDAAQDVPEDGVSVGEAAHLLGISTAAVRKRIRRGTLPALKVGEQWYVVREGLDAGRAAAPDAGHPVGRDAAQDAAQDTSGMRAVDATYDAGRATGQDATRDGELRRLEEHVALLREEVDARRREVQQLHTLLAQAQQLALPPPVDRPEIHRASQAGQDTTGAESQAEASQRRPWWQFW